MVGNKLGRVVAIHPEGPTVDLLMLDDSSHLASVQVMSGSASTDTGLADLTQPDLLDASDPYNLQETQTRDIYAIVSYVGVVPFVMGFLFPQICQMLFKDINRRINRHASDVYTNLTNAGDFEFYHPSGTFFRLAVSAAHEDLTGQDYDKKWKISKNTTTSPRVHLEVHNNGTQYALFDCDAAGNITITNAGTLNSTTTGNVAVKSTNGNVTVTAQNGQVTVDTPTTTFTGAVVIQKTLTVDQGVTGQAGATFAGDVVANGKSLDGHTHLENGAGHQTNPPT